MSKRESYLSERIYQRKREGKLNQERYEYWKKIMGNEVLQKLYDCNPGFLSYLKDEPYENSVKETREELYRYLDILEYSCVKKYDKKSLQGQVYFPEFYVGFISYGTEKLESALRETGKIVSEDIFTDFGLYVMEQLQAVSVRTLIVEMHIYKDKGMLRGQNPKEEYAYYCETILSKQKNVKKLLLEYPVLYRCIVQKIENAVNYFSKVITDFQRDKKAIAGMLSEGNDDIDIVHIESKRSDLHNGGRQIVNIRLNNGAQILYKPHSMENEKVFADLLQWLGEGTNISQRRYRFVSFEDHSWSSVVQYESCADQEEIRRYYRRLGVQLFLAYILGTHDLHCENIIASGEYPVLIDLETLVNGVNTHGEIDVEDRIRHHLSQSVLYTGLLPVYSWNAGGNGIDCSGISGGREKYYPFKVPVIAFPGTSQMRIEYQNPRGEKTQNLATINGIFQPPVCFEKELTEGFATAYRYVLNHKSEFERLLKNLSGIKSRFLAADTQRYSMLLSGSYHPILLKDGAEREIYLSAMWKGRNESEKRIVEEEISSLLQGDIPYFEYCLNKKNLTCKTGKEIEDFWNEIPIHKLYEKLGALCEHDLDMQIKYVKTSLRLAPENRAEYENKVYDSRNQNEGKSIKEQLSIHAEKLVDRFINEAFWNEGRTQVNWCQVSLSDTKDMTWEIRSMNIYLYNGLAGMLVLSYEMMTSGERQEIKEIFTTLQNMLFQYTKKGVEEIAYIQSGLTGAYEGEGSIVYTYLYLYEKTKEKIYLDYARLHVKILEQLIKTDEKYDLLSGNAGAAQVLLYLYDVTGEGMYLSLAERAIEVLKDNYEKQQKGIGWKVVKDMPPMSGMAHGNAGILIPIIELWVKTGKDEYRKMADDIWEYEESLFEPEIGNWMDVRGTKEHTGAVAWCHGAGGILLSRIYCYNIVKDMKWKKRLKKDIERAYGTLKNYWMRDSFSLCHGICGNLMILRYANQTKILEDMTDDEMLCRELPLLPHEEMNLGLMDGYGGILYFYFWQKKE